MSVVLLFKARRRERYLRRSLGLNHWTGEGSVPVWRSDPVGRSTVSLFGTQDPVADVVAFCFALEGGRGDSVRKFNLLLAEGRMEDDRRS